MLYRSVAVLACLPINITELCAHSGMWWLPAAADAKAGLLPGISPDMLQPDTVTASGVSSTANQLLQLAVAQRMNTDARRAVFLAIMGSEDCMDAFEKLVKLPLKVTICATTW